MYRLWAVALVAQAAATVEGDCDALDDEHLSLLQLRAQTLETEKQMADSCGNCAAGYTCTAGSIGVSRVQVIRDLGCRGEPDMWVCSVAKAKVACDADETCNSFAVSDKWGLNKAQLFGASDGTPNAGWTLWSVDAGAPECPPDGDEASAAGDPHLITNTGKHYDYTTK